MKEVLKWVAGVLFILFSIAALANQGFVSFMLFSLATIICFPPFLAFVQGKSGSIISSGTKYLLVVFSFILGVNQFPDIKSKKPPKETKNTIVRDTVFIHDTIVRGESTQAKPSLKEKSNSKLVSPITPSTYSETPKKTKKERRGGCTYNGNTLYQGRRGGCYYINSNGNKTYVDRSYCSGCD